MSPDVCTFFVHTNYENYTQRLIAEHKSVIMFTKLYHIYYRVEIVNLSIIKPQ